MTQYKVNGRLVSKEEFDRLPSKFDEGICTPRITRSDHDMKSVALAVDPRDRQKANEIYRRLGVPTWHDEDGCPHFRSRRHQTQYCQVSGYHNKDEIMGGNTNLPDPSDFE